MTLLDIWVLDAPILRQDTTVVTEVTDAHRRLIDDMFETMYAARGIGLAATQVGRLERICVVDVDKARYALVNPEIVASDGEQTGEEGCLSIPEIYGDVTRAQHVVVRALDRDGKPIEIDATDLLARCLQHEIDHLHGRLFIDYLGLVKRQAAIKKWRKLRGKDKSLTRTIEPRDAAEHHDRDEEL
ncbi:MAG TPA: peptide deformylase [Gemmatimonadaceae bacterium]|nr:peptide deformylase [Gemmatimonadaceae bacterium]